MSKSLFRTVSAPVFVLGGFPLLATATVFPDEFGSCASGPGFDLDDIELTTLRGKSCLFITRKMTKAEWGRVDEQIRNHMNHLKQNLED